MGNIFNNDKKKPKAQSSRITDLDRAVLGLKKQRDQLMKMQKQIEVGCETLHRDPRTSSGLKISQFATVQIRSRSNSSGHSTLITEFFKGVAKDHRF